MHPPTHPKKNPTGDGQKRDGAAWMDVIFSTVSAHSTDERSGKKACNNTCFLMPSVFTSFQSFHFIFSNHSLLEAQNTAYKPKLIIARGGSKRNDLENTNWDERVCKGVQTWSVQFFFPSAKLRLLQLIFFLSSVSRYITHLPATGSNVYNECTNTHFTALI